MTNLDAHIKEEEEHDLPALEKAIAVDDSESLAKSFERTKMFVPTRYVPTLRKSHHNKLCSMATGHERGAWMGRTFGTGTDDYAKLGATHRHPTSRLLRHLLD